MNVHSIRISGNRVFIFLPEEGKDFLDFQEEGKIIDLNLNKPLDQFVYKAFLAEAGRTEGMTVVDAASGETLVGTLDQLLGS